MFLAMLQQKLWLMKGKILMIVMRLEAVSCGMNNLMTMLLEEILHLEQLLAISLFLRLEQSKNTTMKGLGGREGFPLVSMFMSKIGREMMLKQLLWLISVY